MKGELKLFRASLYSQALDNHTDANCRMESCTYVISLTDGAVRARSDLICMSSFRLGRLHPPQTAQQNKGFFQEADLWNLQVLPLPNNAVLLGLSQFCVEFSQSGLCWIELVKWVPCPGSAGRSTNQIQTYSVRLWLQNTHSSGGWWTWYFQGKYTQIGDLCTHSKPAAAHNTCRLTLHVQTRMLQFTQIFTTWQL